MKLLKKAGAVFLALVMIVVMIPQLGNKVVKAAETETEPEPKPAAKWDVNDENATTFEEGAIIVGSTTDPKKPFAISNGYNSNVHDKALKFGGSQRFTFTIPQNKYAKIIVWSLTNGDKLSEFQVGDQKISEQKAAGKEVEELKHVIPGAFEGGTQEGGTAYTMKRNSGDILIYRIEVYLYDTIDDVPPDNVDTKVTVSGVITSDVSLEGGTISFLGDKTAKGNLTLKAGTTNQYEYSIDDVVGDGTEYYINVESNAITEEKKLLRSDLLKKATFTVEKDNITDKNFELKYDDITNIWDFTNENMSSFSQENKNELYTYKGLTVNVATGKFAKGTGNFQINKGTKITIPVSGIGTVKCTFSGNVSTVLGNDTSDQNYIETSYALGDNEVVLEMKGSSYLETIEVTDTLAPIAVKGAAIRTQTESWGNGIRFGGELKFTDIAEGDVTESGTLIGLADTVGTEKVVTLNDVGKTCVKVVRSTYIEKTENSLEYAAALINIPDGTQEGTVDARDTKIVARPYVIVDGATYYGDQITTSYNDIQAKMNTK